MRDTQHPYVNITVTSYNRLELTRCCLESLQNTVGVPHAITVVDNNSVDGSREYLEYAVKQGLIDAFLICKRNMGVAVAANMGWAWGEQTWNAPLYVKLDNDVTLLRPDWLATLVNLAEKHLELGSIGYYIEPERPESVQHNAVFCQDYTVGSCILIPKRSHELLGFWNEDYGLYGIEDSDFATRVKAVGLQSAYVTFSEQYIRHHHGLYRNDTQLDTEIRIAHGLSETNTAIFYFNNALFASGVRPVRVERKFIEQQQSDTRFDCVPDPAYLKAESLYLKERQCFIDDYVKACQNQSSAT